MLLHLCQVASGQPPAQLASTLVPIVRCAASNQLSMSFITTAERHTLLLQLMAAEDATVAVLAAEAWCRCAVLCCTVLRCALLCSAVPCSVTFNSSCAAGCAPGTVFYRHVNTHFVAACNPNL
jgi:hypothetical protein